MNIKKGQNGKASILTFLVSGFVFAIVQWEIRNSDLVCRLVLKFLHVFFLNQLYEFRSFSADRSSVHLASRRAEFCGAGDDDLIGIHEFRHCERCLIDRDPVVFADLDDVHSCDAREDVVVGRVSLEDPVFDDGDIAVGALGDNIAAVEDALPPSHGLGFLSSHNVHKEV